MYVNVGQSLCQMSWGIPPGKSSLLSGDGPFEAHPQLN